MFRRWQKEAVDKYRTLESFNTFLSRLMPLNSPDPLEACDAADLYSVLSVLHSKGRDPQLQVNISPGFYYFLANAVQPDGTVAGQENVTSAGVDGGALGNLASAATGYVRREAVVPISSKSTLITVSFMSKIFQLGAHSNVTHILLAIVDDDGSVSLVRVFNYLQPPFEGPDTLPPLEAGGEGGIGGESDDG
ncbi:hypothetical protein Vretifemale_3930 [Volvox reticuliferus]|nr:hypothetical protein Vretifemale_3930 [Volvox reticuliferus]